MARRIAVAGRAGDNVCFVRKITVGDGAEQSIEAGERKTAKCRNSAESGDKVRNLKTKKLL